MSKSGRGKKGKKTGFEAFFYYLDSSGASGYVVAFYRNFARSAGAGYKPVEAQQVRDSAILLEEKKPIAILLMGIDNGVFGRDEDGGNRSDAFIVVTLNPEEPKTTMVSILRDTVTEIVGNDFYDKITYAYWYGGAKIAINTVQKMLDIPIDYYISVDMAGIQKIVDAVCGIDVARLSKATVFHMRKA